MNLKAFLLKLAESCDNAASDEGASHQGRVDSSTAAQALKAAAERVDSALIVVSNDPD